MIVNKKRALRVDQRRQIVASILLRTPNVTQREIVVKLTEQGFVNPNTEKPYSLTIVHKDVNFLQAQWRENAMESINKWKGLQIEQLNEIIRYAWKKKDVKTVLDTIKLQSDIVGTKASLKLEHLGANAEPIQFIIKNASNTD